MTYPNESHGDMDVSRETMGALSAYADLIGHWSPRINLVSKSSLADIWVRHIQDSQQVSSIPPDNVESWADLGSGGGLPGIVVSILRPQTRVFLVESDQRKAAFLRTCVRELALNATVVSNRIEATAPIGAKVVSARALAPLSELLGYVTRHIAPDGIAILPKGRNVQVELAEAQKKWSFTHTSTVSQTDPEASILRLERITRA